MGDAPDWYELLVAAKFLGVPPWELLEQPIYWKRWALEAASAEGGARQNKEAASNRKAKAGVK